MSCTKWNNLVLHFLRIHWLAAMTIDCWLSWIVNSTIFNGFSSRSYHNFQSTMQHYISHPLADALHCKPWTAKSGVQQAITINMVSMRFAYFEFGLRVNWIEKPFIDFLSPSSLYSVLYALWPNATDWFVYFFARIALTFLVHCVQCAHNWWAGNSIRCRWMVRFHRFSFYVLLFLWFLLHSQAMQSHSVIYTLFSNKQNEGK